MSATYTIKCDDCKTEIGTGTLRESASGGRCDACKVKTLRDHAVSLTRAQDTETLAHAFLQTDKLIDSLRADAVFNLADYRAVIESRGWIMEVLEERGELAAIGLTADYTPLVQA